MNPSLKLATRTFPARIADLGFTVQLPADWISHELPPEEVDFSNPTNLFPLAIALGGPQVLSQAPAVVRDQRVGGKHTADAAADHGY